MSSTKTALPFTTLDVFTSTPFAGNPLGLVLLKPEHHSLAQEVKQRIAREFNLSETVFLHVPSDDDSMASPPTALRLDIFTTDRELPFAGHPTIGTASYLLLGDHSPYSNVTTLNIKAGAIAISKSADGLSVCAAIPHDVHLHARTLGSLLLLLGADATTTAGLSAEPTIRAAELAAPLFSIVKGMTFALVALPCLARLGSVATSSRLDFDGLPAPGLLDEGPWRESFTSRYYYVPLGVNEETGAVKVRARMVELEFEDPATGSAACALAGYLATSGSVRDDLGERVSFEVEQGVEMGRRSVILVEVVRERVGDGDGGWKVKEVFLGGTSVVVMKGVIEV